MSSDLTPGQLTALSVTERVNSCISLVGIFFVIGTYLGSAAFDKPINRLIFFASFGNLGSNIASLISEAGPLAGPASALCQFQAFLVQMFLGVDCYWALCMALNVYLVFFRGYTVSQLRALDVRYLLVCYGMALVPALVFVFVDTPDQGHVYGPAVIWCWITTEWDWMRIVFLYGIVWLAVIVAFIVYAMAAQVIWTKRAHLDGFLNPLNENPFTNTVTTEIEITHEARPIVKEDDHPGFGSEQSVDVDPYSVHVRVNPPASARPLPAALRMRTLTRDAAERETNAEAWLYARVAFLFFVALLITWVPTSVNRMYALANPTVFNYPLNYLASFLFPLQGFWNVIVYVLSSQTAVRRLFDGWGSGRRRRRRCSMGGSTQVGSREHARPFPGGKQRLQSFSSLG